jgi:hypothetical protein
MRGMKIKEEDRVKRRKCFLQVLIPELHYLTEAMKLYGGVELHHSDRKLRQPEL